MSRPPVLAWRRPMAARGVSLMTAIFLLVVLSGLAGAIMNLYISQQVSSGRDIQGARAYQAARAGVEWGLYQQLRNQSCTAATTISLTAPTLQAFTVTVRCTKTITGTEPGVVTATLAAGTTDLAGVASLAGMREGMRVSGPGVPAGTVVTVVDPASNNESIRLSNAVTLSGSRDLTFESSLDRWRIVASACTQAGADGACPNSAPTNNDYVARELNVEF